MGFAYQENSTPDTALERLNCVLAYYARLTIYELLRPNKFCYYMTSDVPGYHLARDRWKRAFVRFQTAQEYRDFHEKMV